MDVNVMIDLTERTERAIRDLCAALTANKETTTTAALPVPEVPAAPAVPTPAPMAVTEMPAAPSNPAPAPTAAPVQAPAAPVATPAPAVPLSQAPAFTKAQVASAGAALIQADPSKKEPLQALLAQYGVPSVADLPEEHVGTFATALRGLGANI